MTALSIKEANRRLERLGGVDYGILGKLYEASSPRLQDWLENRLGPHGGHRLERVVRFALLAHLTRGLGVTTVYTTAAHEYDFQETRTAERFSITDPYDGRVHAWRKVEIFADNPEFQKDRYYSGNNLVKTTDPRIEAAQLQAAEDKRKRLREQDAREEAEERARLLAATPAELRAWYAQGRRFRHISPDEVSRVTREKEEEIATSVKRATAATQARAFELWLGDAVALYESPRLGGYSSFHGKYHWPAKAWDPLRNAYVEGFASNVQERALSYPSQFVKLDASSAPPIVVMEAANAANDEAYAVRGRGWAVGRLSDKVLFDLTGKKLRKGSKAHEEVLAAFEGRKVETKAEKAAKQTKAEAADDENRQMNAIQSYCERKQKLPWEWDSREDFLEEVGPHVPAPDQLREAWDAYAFGALLTGVASKDTLGGEVDSGTIRGWLVEALKASQEFQREWGVDAREVDVEKSEDSLYDFAWDGRVSADTLGDRNHPTAASNGKSTDTPSVATDQDRLDGLQYTRHQSRTSMPIPAEHAVKAYVQHALSTLLVGKFIGPRASFNQAARLVAFRAVCLPKYGASRLFEPVRDADHLRIPEEDPRIPDGMVRILRLILAVKGQL